MNKDEAKAAKLLALIVLFSVLGATVLRIVLWLT